MGWLKLIGYVAKIATAISGSSPTLGDLSAWMTEGAVIELGRLGGRIDPQETVDIRVILMGAVGPLHISRAS
jgi:hypothetical protein